MLYISYNSFTNLSLSICLFFVKQHIWVCFSISYSQSPNASNEQGKLLEKKISSLSRQLVILIFILMPTSKLLSYQASSFIIFQEIQGLPPAAHLPPATHLPPAAHLHPAAHWSGTTLGDLWLLSFFYQRSFHTLKNTVRQVKCYHTKIRCLYTADCGF